MGSEYSTSPETDLWKLYPKATYASELEAGDSETAQLGLAQVYCDPSGLLINLYPVTKPAVGASPRFAFTYNLKHLTFV